jgi:AcrR family transcriptional regulator
MSERATYHHGDLRRALTDAALALVTERGPKGFTLTEVARRAGVSAAAPYRHFTDKAHLLAVVAEVGFDRLHAALTDPALSDNTPAPLVELSRRYVRWAIANPDAYQVMFGIDVDRRNHPDLIAAADRAFGVVLTAAGSVPRSLVPPLDDARALAAALWALAHGAASLHIGGDLRNAGVTTPTDELAAAATDALLADITRQQGVRHRTSPNVR